ncbi:TPA: S-methyl-5'-thioadenosine phosphorylase [archaeon]|uniref:Purine nucleoside phosphorylase n=1 Tax=Candidatus Naiadarchaeum limnaeum TaxID=2756139 RepID=A0A832V0X0_9ARCH|nr:S-methyl-5'-thioadenosine phosphorylase [Candidatus Naiadarchaeum limnaeum]
MAKALIGIIGGTGVYDPKLLENSEEISVETKYGAPSDKITIGIYAGKKVAFLPRHARGHKIPPHKINYRANISALKELGVKRILAPQAVGSMQEKYKPGDLVIPDQFIDRTHTRENTFFDGPQVAHVSTADPFCSELRDLLIKTGKSLKFKIHSGGTYICIQGPRFSTRAESNLFRKGGVSVIGMTLVPECVLAREAEICYSSISMVTDYDCWKKGHTVSTAEIIRTVKANEDKVKKMLQTVLSKISEKRTCACKDALKGALV